MYRPASFDESDLAKLHDTIEAHSFATLISQHDQAPCASHLPLLLDRKSGPYGTLIGHMARANPQWEDAGGQEVLTIFHGPHAYISPSWCDSDKAVPTWNYVAVHCYGTLELETSPDQLRQIVHDYVTTYEKSFDSPWSTAGSAPGFLDSLLHAIVGFRIRIDRIEGKWKLNQNHDADRRRKIIEGLEASSAPNDLEIAELMKQTLK
ncbi:MAG: FMN-binding negative transcriptional regulator [Planctomycetaceae bacterium]|jgi:transcriptional regulator|nr:FMN-binding negative transcriptional regulator [Planctomycetaceae bacterium]